MRPSRTATCVAVGIDGFIVTMRRATKTLVSDICGVLRKGSAGARPSRSSMIKGAFTIEAEIEEPGRAHLVIAEPSCRPANAIAPERGPAALAPAAAAWYGSHPLSGGIR